MYNVRVQALVHVYEALITAEPILLSVVVEFHLKSDSIMRLNQLCCVFYCCVGSGSGEWMTGYGDDQQGGNSGWRYGDLEQKMTVE